MKYTEGNIEFEGEIINELKADERAKKGIFLSFQYPEEIPGVTVEEFLRTAKMAVSGKHQRLWHLKRIKGKNGSIGNERRICFKIFKSRIFRWRKEEE